MSLGYLDLGLLTGLRGSARPLSLPHPPLAARAAPVATMGQSSLNYTEPGFLPQLLAQTSLETSTFSLVSRQAPNSLPGPNSL